LLAGDAIVLADEKGNIIEFADRVAAADTALKAKIKGRGWQSYQIVPIEGWL
jgi:phosphoribosylaminoimidazole-succinocarboxamide synthase